MLRFITTADNEILAADAAVRRLPQEFPQVVCANPYGALDHQKLIDEILDGASVVVCRILGGRRGWQEGFDQLQARCVQEKIPLIALGGESQPDAQMTELSTVPAGTVAHVGEYLRHGDVDNIEQMLRFLADTFLLEGFGFEEPTAAPDFGFYIPGKGDLTLEEACKDFDPNKPTIGICFYRSHRLTGNTQWVDTLAQSINEVGGNALPIWSYTLRRSADGQVPALQQINGHVDGLITTMLATGGSAAGDAEHEGGDGVGEAWQQWDAAAIEELGVPVVQAICCTSSRAWWQESEVGLKPLDAATQVAIPEFDGRITGGVVSFKEKDDQNTVVGTAVPRYIADAERCRRVAGIAVRHAGLKKIAAQDKRLAMLLTAFPTKHARVGMAVGLDTPASAVRLLEAWQQEGIQLEHDFADGDALIHELIQTGGHDAEYLTAEQLAAAPLRLTQEQYQHFYAQLTPQLRESMEEKWGPAPGDRYIDETTGDFVIAGISLGNVVVAIQPPRGYGEDPVGIYHDPELAPSHHYMASYFYLTQVWAADAIVHLGKHGTLEWLPGKMIGLSESCAPDAALRDVPLIYPFVVNDPGEGVQAKRRAHAVIIDHLTPPMMRAEVYDEMAELEGMLDEYARLEVLDPSKLPALAVKIWSAIERANLQAELGVEDRPEDLGELIEHIDGYLCEVKDIQIKDGLHVLGQVPPSDQLRGLSAAILRLGSGDVVGLRKAVGIAFGLDEQQLIDNAGLKAQNVPAKLSELFPGPATSNGDLVDRLEEAQASLLAQLEKTGWDAEAAHEVAVEVLGDDVAAVATEVTRTLRFTCTEVLPRLYKTTDEISNLQAALRGEHIPAGPSGAPTRGRLDVLPTGRNFYSVDPRALPSELSFDVGVKLADAVIDRYKADNDGKYPQMIGIICWGTAAMRTMGDDVAEIFALLGVKPRWNRESKRITGLDVIPLAELGRPRIDVTVRISGFFRDAFPHLLELIDDAVTTVAALDEPDDQNYVAAHARADAKSLASELDEKGAWRRATTRVFGSKPGTYGAGLLQLIDSRDWRDDTDIAQVYEAWGGYAYGRGLKGEQATEAMRESFKRIQVAVKNVDSREHDLLDSDDYFQYHGGMITLARVLTGKEPAAYIGDSSDPTRVVNRTLVEETKRVFRARVANPRWIASMVRHGYKGAAELSATVDYLFGYDATAGVAEDWMYEQVAEKYVLDPDIAEFMVASNPWAAQAISERLLEAAERGMWKQPSAETIDQIKQRFLQLDAQLEEAK